MNRSLRLVAGGDRLVLGSIVITAAREDAPPFEVSGRVFEDDRYLVLSAPPDLRDPGDHPIQILTDVLEQEPRQPGTVVLRGGRGGSPREILAIVHDLDQDPTVRVEWIRSALTLAFDAAERLGISQLAVPLVGSVYGRIEPLDSAAIIADVLGTAERKLERVWLIVPPGLESAALDVMEKRAKASA